MQTILGAGGVIGLELAGILPDYTDRLRLVSRNPKATHPNSEAHPADLLDGAAVEDAVKGSEVVYLLAGLPYKARVWESQWPDLAPYSASSASSSSFTSSSRL
jgi:nucleoside-diphosphate-sugar epimerase